MTRFWRALRTAIRDAEAHTNSQFYKSQWQQSAGLHRHYVVYRIIIAIIFTVLLFAAMADIDKVCPEFGKFFIYVTHWGFILCTVQTILAAVVVTRKYMEVRELSSETQKIRRLSNPSKLLEIYWIMYTMSVVCSFGITLLFWTKVYVPSYHHFGIMAFILHGVNTIIMLIDVVIVAIPLKFVHFLWTSGFVLIYLFFSYVYYLAGGTNYKNHPFIYHSLDWDKPEHALKFGASSLMYGFVVHVIMWAFSAVIRKVSGASTVDASSSHHHHHHVILHRHKR